MVIRRIKGLWKTIKAGEQPGTFVEVSRVFWRSRFEWSFGFTKGKAVVGGDSGGQFCFLSVEIFRKGFALSSPELVVLWGPIAITQVVLCCLLHTCNTCWRNIQDLMLLSKFYFKKIKKIIFFSPLAPYEEWCFEVELFFQSIDSTWGVVLWGDYLNCLSVPWKKKTNQIWSSMYWPVILKWMRVQKTSCTNLWEWLTDSGYFSFEWNHFSHARFDKIFFHLLQ